SERGVVWGTSPDPTTGSNDGSATTSGTTGAFTVPATGLTPGTTYHYRAYATNAVGTSYTADGVFTTAPAIGSLLVYIKPSGARDAGAAWRISGWDEWHPSGYSETGIRKGGYTVEFKQIDGWTTPGELSVYVEGGWQTSVTVEYTKQIINGIVHFKFSPKAAALQGVAWRIKSGPAVADKPAQRAHEWRVLRDEVSLPAGRYVIELLPVPGWLHPDVRFKVEAGRELEVELNYLPFLVTACCDFDGDGCGDIALYRPSTRIWLVKDQLEKRFGGKGVWPAAGDYDGDGAAELAYWRPKKGLWRVHGQYKLKKFGELGDVPVPGDYDGDGICDPALYRPSSGEWLLVLSGEPGAAGVTVKTLGGSGHDIPVPGDYDGDGVVDIAIYNLESRSWIFPDGVKVKYGRPGELPVPADYDGDGETDPALADMEMGLWRVKGQFLVRTSMAAGDIPLVLDSDKDGKREPAFYRRRKGCVYIVMMSYIDDSLDVSEVRIKFGSEEDILLNRGR
ncbi:MAG TPA: hypothetical protein VMX35_14990, partial [Acidobacteriota bacterium]|nr:hypothetical protein [Acidobacteriota bacterium]